MKIGKTYPKSLLHGVHEPDSEALWRSGNQTSDTQPERLHLYRQSSRTGREKTLDTGSDAEDVLGSTLVVTSVYITPSESFDEYQHLQDDMTLQVVRAATRRLTNALRIELHFLTALKGKHLLEVPHGRPRALSQRDW